MEQEEQAWNQEREAFFPPFFGMAQLMDIPENGDVIPFH